jgi:large subunit ribosomal protein L9
MKVKVLLLKNVKGLGNARSVVSVSRGYALNYLIPRGLAKEINEKGAEKVVNKIKNEEQAKIVRAEEEKKLLESKPIKFSVKSGENGKLFGSITSSDIGDKIAKVFDIKIDKKRIRLEKPIKKLGEYEVSIKLYKDVNAILKLLVVKGE